MNCKDTDADFCSITREGTCHCICQSTACKHSFWTAIRDGLEMHSAGQVPPAEMSLRIPESFSMTLVGSRTHAAQPAANHMVQDTGQIRTSPSPYCRYIFYISRHTYSPMLKHLEKGTIMGSFLFWKKEAKAILTPHTWDLQADYRTSISSFIWSPLWSFVIQCLIKFKVSIFRFIRTFSLGFTWLNYYLKLQNK